MPRKRTRRLTEDDIYQCGRCGDMWWGWEGHGPAGPRSHECIEADIVRWNQLELEL